MTDHTTMSKVSRLGDRDWCPASLDVGREAPDREREPRWAAAGIGDGAAEWTVCEPAVHVAPSGPRGASCRGRQWRDVCAGSDQLRAFDQRSAVVPGTYWAPENSPSSSCPVEASGRMEIMLTGGRRVIVDNGVDAAALARVIDVLERRQ